ncbi:PD-(D/E)XK nuclease-like domain-containing protein [Sulfurimonas sp. NWX79]|uniref:PD-(D/E)XK nuclease-like domain-containing protein n=1 Tax=Sulfurimonas sp. NWX79 TaxID=2925412 RepID=UPI003204F8AC
MTNKEYHETKGISSSDFRLLERSPVHLHFKELFKLSGSSLEFGSALHKLVLETDTFHEEFAIAPDLPKNTKAGKESHAKFLEGLGERTAITKSDYATIEKMALNIKAIAGGLLKGGVAESSHFAADENGIVRKCRPDYFIEDKGLVIDVKTTKDNSEYGFKKAIYDYRYHRQAAWYIDTLQLNGKKASRFIFITVEKTAPYIVSIYELDQKAIQRGRDEYQRLLNDYVTYLNTNKANVVKSIGLPDWTTATQDELETY